MTLSPDLLLSLLAALLLMVLAEALLMAELSRRIGALQKTACALHEEIEAHLCPTLQTVADQLVQPGDPETVASRVQRIAHAVAIVHGQAERLEHDRMRRDPEYGRPADPAQLEALRRELATRLKGGPRAG